MNIVAGKVFEPQAATLRVTFEDGGTRALPFVYVSEPINAGFFAYKPTPAQEQVGHRPSGFLLLTRDGATIAEKTIDWTNEDRKAERVKELSQTEPAK
jgi:hypothetical protein